MIRAHYMNIDRILEIPPPTEGQDKGVWKYEHIR